MHGEPKSSFRQVLHLLFAGVISAHPASKREHSAERVSARISFPLKFGVKTILSLRTSPTSASRHKLSQPQCKAVASPSSASALPVQNMLDMPKRTSPQLGQVSPSRLRKSWSAGFPNEVIYPDRGLWGERPPIAGSLAQDHLTPLAFPVFEAYASTGPLGHLSKDGRVRPARDST